MIVRELQIDDDIIGQHMTVRPEYNGKVGTIEGIVNETVMINGVPSARSVRYLVLWADGARSLQRSWQVRLPTMQEEANAYAHVAELLLRI